MNQSNIVKKKPVVSAAETEETVHDADIISNENVVLEESDVAKSAIYTPVDRDDDTLGLLLLPTTLSNVEKTLEGLDNISDPDDDYLKWAFTVSRASDNMIKGEVYEDSFRKENSKWKLTLDTEEGKRIRPQVLKIGDTSKNDHRLTRQQALAKVNSLLGKGLNLDIPLYHSGIWISLSVPSDVDLLLLEQLIASEKIAQGRRTNGIMYGNTSVYVYRHLYDLIKKFIITTSLGDNVELLDDVILLPDIQTLAWGLMASTHPDGYNLDYPCVHDVTKCNHITKGKVNLNKLLWVDNNALTSWQKQHMSNPTAKKTIEEVKRYQEEGQTKYRKIDLVNGICATLQTPTISDEINAGYAWLNDITESIDIALGDELDDEQRELKISQAVNLTYVCNYAHYVRNIHFKDSEDVIDDEDVILETLKSFSEDNDVSEALLTGIQRYINETPVSIIALPKYACPKCKKEPVSKEHDKHPDLMAINAVSVFFTLVDQKLARVSY